MHWGRTAGRGPAGLSTGHAPIHLQPGAGCLCVPVRLCVCVCVKMTKPGWGGSRCPAQVVWLHLPSGKQPGPQVESAGEGRKWRRLVPLTWIL